MEYYESYFDEDLDEALTEDHDEFFENYDEAEDFGEDRASRRQRRQQRRDTRRSRRQDRRDRRQGKGRGGKSPGDAATTGAVQDAFDNVGQDVAKVQKEVKKAEVRQSNEQMNDAVASILLRPSLVKGTPVLVRIDSKTKAMVSVGGALAADEEYAIRLVDSTGKIIEEDGKPVTEVAYRLEDNLLPLLAVKLLGNMKGMDTAKGGFQQYLPLLAGVLLSPSAQKSLGIGGNSAGAGNSLSLSSLTNNPTLMLLLLLLLMRK